MVFGPPLGTAQRIGLPSGIANNFQERGITMSFHLYRINELYSNADGSVPFIEMSDGNSNAE